MTHWVLLATGNQTKASWMRGALAHLPLEIRPPPPGTFGEVAETGGSCEENALLKARSVKAPPGAIVVAEDSGLFVEALDGLPGTHTARWAPGTDDDRSLRLIELLAGVEPPRRGARFVSAAVVRYPGGREECHVGVLPGRILAQPGPSGTGYGGVFGLAEGGRLSEVPGTGPHRLSALGKASRAIASWLARQ